MDPHPALTESCDVVAGGGGFRGGDALPFSPAKLAELQREAALGYMGERARALLADGYAADADRLLDEICETRKGGTGR